MYARESIEHTLDYEGWEDGFRKMGRITTGKFAQLWLHEFCRLNGIPSFKDKSSPFVPDREDLRINGYSIDSKVTMRTDWDGQVSKNHDKAKADIDIYAFFRTNKIISFIEPLGFCWANELDSVGHRVNEGEMIPGTNVKQRFGHSYFIDAKDMKEFLQFLEWMKNNRKQKDEIVQADDDLPF